MIQKRRHADSDQLHGGEEVADFEGRGFRGIRAVRAVHLDAGAEIAADGAGSSFLWIGSAHDLAPLGDGAVGFENHSEDFAGTHEVGEFAEEGTLAVDGVETRSFFPREAHGFDGDDFEAGFVNAREYFTLKIAVDRVRFNDCESAFDGQVTPPNLASTIFNYSANCERQLDYELFKSLAPGAATIGGRSTTTVNPKPGLPANLRAQTSGNNPFHPQMSP